MRQFLIVIFLLTTSIVYSQMEITLKGDPTDSAFIKQKMKFEAKGFKVEVVNSLENNVGEIEDTSGDQVFIKKYTNSKLPDFEFLDIEGEKISSDDLIGKKVHINFWSTTCKPCIQEFPELNELKKVYEDQGFVFIAFAPESKKKVKKVLNKHSLDYRIITDAKDYYDLLGIGGYPKNFFIDENGKIVKVTDGANFKGELKDGKLILIPDNYKIYDAIVKGML